MRGDIAEAVRILMERDGDTKDKALNRIKECREMAKDCEYEYDAVEDILAEELGLEMDYAFALL